MFSVKVNKGMKGEPMKIGTNSEEERMRRNTV
jgi:hypothetical protein